MDTSRCSPLHQTSAEPDDEDPDAPPANTRLGLAERYWWVLALLVAVALAAVAGYSISHGPGKAPTREPIPSETLQSDSDGDGLPDDVELSGWAIADGGAYRTDPSVADTDGDGLSDGEEAGALKSISPSGRVYSGLSNPTKADSDDDGLSDRAELRGWRTQVGAVFRTDPLIADTDGDGLNDGDEAGTLTAHPTTGLVYTGISDPTKTDSDADGLDDRAEVRGWATQSGTTYRTKPMTPDTDGDGLLDGDEAGTLIIGESRREVYSGFSDPLLLDTDGDGLTDAQEADHSLDAFDRDSDADSLDDGFEVQILGTSPHMADTDGDGLEDGYEEANRESQGLDPLCVDVKIGKWEYATDFAKGAVAGDLWREDSVAWLVGNLASGGASFIPGVGWVVGGVADVRDAVGSAIHEDWVGVGFSAVGLVPDIGDAVAIPGKAARFVTRFPDLAPVVAHTIISLNKVPEHVKVETLKQIWRSWDDLLATGMSEKALLRLQSGKTDLDALAAATKRPTHLSGPPARFFDTWPDGEKFIEDLYGADSTGVTKQVRVPTEGCTDVCNSSNIRIIDAFVDGVAHEAKVGYKTLTVDIEKQIRSDAHLIKNGVVEGAHWHFLPSGTTNKLGASPSLLNLLDELGIRYTFHLPADG